MRHAQRGLTLIELAVAMAIVAVLGVLSYQGLSQVLNGREMLHEDLERWRGITRALEIVDTDLSQCATLPVKAGTPATPAFRLLVGNHSRELNFLALGGEGLGLRRVGLHFEDGRLSWLRWDDRDGRGARREDVLLDKVRDMRWRFLFEGKDYTSWPPDSAHAQVLPDGAELQLELADAGTLTRFFALH